MKQQICGSMTDSKILLLPGRQNHVILGDILLVFKICKSHFPHRLWSPFASFLKPIKGASPYEIITPLLIYLRLFVVLPNCFGYLLFASIS